MKQKTVANRIESFSKNGTTSDFTKTLDGGGDYKPPLYNVWKFAKKTNSTSHFGNSEQRIVDNLLYLYTEPFDIVLDPFASRTRGAFDPLDIPYVGRRRQTHVNLYR